jgi:hypothetical protein
MLVGGEWQGRLRSRGAVMWASERFGSVEKARRAVEGQLATRPELMTAALALLSGRASAESAVRTALLPEPMLLAA